MKKVLIAIVSLLLMAPSVPLLAAAEVSVDNPSATVVGTWSTGTGTGMYGADYLYTNVSAANGKTATYTPDIPTTAADWQVYTQYPSFSKPISSAEYIIHHAAGDTTVNINQGDNPGTWVYLGTFTMNAGTGNYVTITNKGTPTNKIVAADAVRFYSPSVGDITPPVISSVSASPGTNSATITWTTDEPATSQAEYGETAAYGNETVKDTNLVTNHSVNITGLVPGTLYHYRVKSDDAAGNPAVSGDYTFTTTTPEPEYRAIWADTWHNGFLSSTETTNLMNTLAAAHYNVLVPEIRKAGDAYYDSAYEPWATNISEPGYDPLADLITKGHAQGIEIHGWLVAYRIWRTNWPAPPPDHIWSVHPDWAMTNSSGGIEDGYSYNLDPGVPGVQQYICDVVKDIVSNYPGIDGINFDYIRYPGTAWGYNELTKQRFYDEYGYWPPTSSGDPNWGTWCDYRRQQVTDLVKKCWLEATAIKRTIKMSPDTVAWSGGDPNTDFTGTRQWTDVFQDGKGWMEQHIVDVTYQMNYKREYDPDQGPDYRLWSDYLADLAAASGMHGVDGNAAYLNAIADSVTQMLYSRSVGNDGMCNYSYAVTNKDSLPAGDFFSAVVAGVYPSYVPTPDMPWKSAPTTGVIFGTVTDASQPNDAIYQNWIYKATVQVSGPVTRSTLTDATGTYGFLDLPPGTYSVTCSKSGFPTHVYSNQMIAAGDMLRDDFDLGYVTASSPSSAVNPPWALFSLPMEPVNPDPASVLSGIPLDYRLFRWDKPTQSLIAYDELMPGDFGNLNLDEGCWLYVDSPYTISYQAYGGGAATRTVSLPRTGWSIVGCPFLVEKNWADMQVTQGTTTVSLETARNNGWIYSIGYYWDSETQSLIDVGLPDDLPTSTTLQPWHGHWVRSFVDNLSLTQR